MQPPEVTRRVFLNRTLQTLGAAATLPLTATQTLAGGGAGSALDLPELEFLRPGEFATLAALADSLIPQGGAFGLGARDVGLARRIDSYLPTLDPAVANGFRGALAYVESQAPALAGEPAPFSALGDRERENVLEAMLRQPGLSRAVFIAMKYFCVVHFYTVDETWEFTGYDGPMLLEDME